ncbi:MAG TPA: DoxX family protein [Ktedonobacterales bacterium]|nr:DoxX family protein [Ktedonobacterales bacterium]
MVDLALLMLRGTLGTLMAGHGAQKLFGWFGGGGIKGTTGFMEMLNLKPGQQWATLASASEFGGGVLTAVGLLNPVGELAILGSMGMATATAHRGKPIWVTSGGAELPVTNMAIVAALMAAGPGKYSLDNALNLRAPRWTVLPGIAAVGGVIAYAIVSGQRAATQQAQSAAAAEPVSPASEIAPQAV